MEPTRGASWLVAGLGNPGPGYRETRHNVGYAVVDRLAAEAGSRFRPGRHAVEAAPLLLAGVAVTLLKPQTFMNGSGPAVAAWRVGLGLPADRMVVVHDDLDLEAGRLRLVAAGGAGGHRGVLSIQAAAETREFPRVRVGIGRPPEGLDAAEFVLRPFLPEERPAMDAACLRAVVVIRDIVREGLAAAMNRHNIRPRPAERTEGAERERANGPITEGR
ncbi:MAG: aminoacyl-tRNA hydrolase [Candidatus Methylomirabilota bacterium]